MTEHPPGGREAGGACSCLFVIKGSFSHINRQLLAALRAERPDIAFDVLDIGAALGRDPLGKMRCGIGALADYGLSSLRSKGRLRFRMQRSRAYFREARRLIEARLGARHYDFTLQTQSLFDGATRTRPHFIYTDHVARARELSTWDEGVGRPSEAWLQLERQAYAAATHVFTFGPQIRRLLIERYGVPGTSVSAVGAGASVLPSRPPETGAARYAGRSIVFVGVEWERKGGPELVAAFQEVRKALPDATLTIIGCQPELRVAGCTVLGRLPPEEVAEHYHRASCFCMPSKLEPYGVVFTEAMHFALPVVAADVGDVGSIVEDGTTGRLVPPGDSTALAAALIEVLGDPDRARAMGLTALDRAPVFTWPAVARRIAARLPCGGTVPSASGEVLEWRSGFST